MSDKYKDSDKEAFDRIRDALINWRDATIDLKATIAEAKDREIWKLKYDSWTDFCQIECGITKQWANRLVLANKAMLQIANSEPQKPETPNLRKPLQNRETGGNTVSGDFPDFTLVTQNDGLSNSAPVQEPKNRLQPTAIQVRKDSIGRVLPEEIVSDWDRAEEVAATLQGFASKIKVTVERGLADRDIIFAEIMNPTIGEASGLHYTLSQIAPHALCPNCQGRNRKNCQLCRGRGWISKFLFNSPSVSAKTREILEKAKAK